MIKYSNLSAHKPTSFISLSGNEDALPVIEDNVSFVSDIQLMMYGLGDSQQPNTESAELVESIVLDQMISLLYQALEVTHLTGRTVVAPEDILFLMKRNMRSLKRLIVYLGVKDEAQNHSSWHHPGVTADGSTVTAVMVEGVPDSLGGQEIEGDLLRLAVPEKFASLDWKKGRKKYCLAYLKRINIEESDLNQIVDVIKETRLNRANTIALQLSNEEYETFHEARCKSFCSTNLTQRRFHKWLTNKGGWKDEITDPVLEIVIYFAKETIACLVDMVMTLREEALLSSKVVVFRRLPDDRLADDRVLLIEEVKADKATPVTDGATPSVCSALSRQGKFFAAASGKKLVLWETTDWKALGSKNLLRAASCIAFSSSEDKILLSDKSGDAYLFKKDDFDSNENQATPESAHLLGHVSMLLRIASSPDDRFVITCDRDEKIRVSRLPNAYNIQTYCLGHTDAVTCFNIPFTKPDVLISGSSDGTIRFWQFLTGKELLAYSCFAGEEEALIVDLVTLPVNDTSVLISVIFKKKGFIRLLLADFAKNPVECTHLEDVPTACTTPLSLIASGNELFVLSIDSPNFVSAFRSHGESLEPCKSLNDDLQNSLRKFNDDFTTVTENIADDRLFTYLNKRKIDDTQEYYKRKNERLLGK